MVYYSKLVDKELIDKAQKELEKLGKESMLPFKLRAIISCKDNTIKSVSQIIGCSQATLINWLKGFKSEGIKAINSTKRKVSGRKSIIDDKVKSFMLNVVKNNPSITILSLTKMIECEFDIKPSKSTVHNHLRNLRYSYITPRKQHHLQDKGKLNEFKKNSSANFRKRKNSQKKD